MNRMANAVPLVRKQTSGAAPLGRNPKAGSAERTHGGHGAGLAIAAMFFARATNPPRPRRLCTSPRHLGKGEITPRSWLSDWGDPAGGERMLCFLRADEDGKVEAESNQPSHTSKVYYLVDL
jgi:hypothetical protein